METVLRHVEKRRNPTFLFFQSLGPNKSLCLKTIMLPVWTEVRVDFPLRFFPAVTFKMKYSTFNVFKKLSTNFRILDFIELLILNGEGVITSNPKREEIWLVYRNTYQFVASNNLDTRAQWTQTVARLGHV